MDVATISAVAALAGVILGHLLTRSGEYRKWLRSERHHACADFLGAVEQAHNEFLVQNIVSINVGGAVRKALSSRGDATVAKLRQEARMIASGADDALIDRAIARAYDSASPEQASAGMLALYGRDPVSEVSTIHGLTERLGMKLAAVELVCPTSVAESAHRLFDATLDMRKFGHDGTRHGEGLDQAYNSAYDRFIAEARRTIEPQLRARWARL